jgi:hypothetical protein
MRFLNQRKKRRREQEQKAHELECLSKTTLTTLQRQKQRLEDSTERLTRAASNLEGKLV